MVINNKVMNEELKSLLYVVIKNQCKMMVMLENIEREIESNNYEPDYNSPQWISLQEQIAENRHNLSMSLFKECLLEAKIIQSENLEI